MNRAVKGAVLSVGVAGVVTALTMGPSTATPPHPTDGITTTLTQARFNPINLAAHTPGADIWRARIRTRGLSDVYIADNKFAPHSDTGWHSHPGPSLILVVQGSVTNYDSSVPGCPAHVYTAGQGFVDAGGRDAHNLRNETGAPAETMAVQILPKDAERRIDEPKPRSCRGF